MDAFEFSRLLLNNKISQIKSEIIEEETKLASSYLSSLMMLHKYLDYVCEQDKKNKNLKKIQIFNLTRIIEGFVTANHMLASRYYNASMAELRNNIECLNIIKAVTINKDYLQTYLSKDALKILQDFQPFKTRKIIGSTPYDVIHNFLISYQTHPFYMGSEFLLSIDLNSSSSKSVASKVYHPTLDIVVSIMIMLTYLHTYFQVSTSFGTSSLIPTDKDVLVHMFSGVEKFMKKYYSQIKNHRFIATVIDDFMNTFVALINANISSDTEAIKYNTQLRETVYQLRRDQFK